MRIMYGFFFWLSIALFTSCSTEVDLIGDFVETPVVYGIIDPTDENIFIRIERAFADPITSAIDLAKDPEIIYYGPEVTAVLEVENKGQTTLQRVNGEDFGIPRAEGALANTPNILYRVLPTGFFLEPEDKVTLSLLRNDTILASSAIELASFVNISLPFAGFNFPFSYTSRSFVQYFSNKPPAFYQIALVVEYEEWEPGGEWETKSLKYIVENEASETRVEVEGIEFFRFLANNITKNDRAIRRMGSIYVEVRSAGREMRDLLAFVRANLGITGAQEVPVYSNIQGGVGVLTSRYTTLKGPFGLTPAAKDLLINGEITAGLRFQ
jgi:hypothetical protein